MSMENLIGKITDYDGEYLTVRVPYADRDYILDHRVTTCGVTLDDGLHISSAQNRALHATFRDISDFTGNPEELTKETLKVMYSKETGIPYFSLAEIGMDDAGRFLDWVLGWCVANDIPLSEKLSARCADGGRMMYACVMAKRCAVCGKPSDLHHVDAIGIGGREARLQNGGSIVHGNSAAASGTPEQSGKGALSHNQAPMGAVVANPTGGTPVMALCREHHGEAHTIGDAAFCEKYAVTPVTVDKRIARKYKLKD